MAFEHREHHDGSTRAMRNTNQKKKRFSALSQKLTSPVVGGVSLSLE